MPHGQAGQVFHRPHPGAGRTPLPHGSRAWRVSEPGTGLKEILNPGFTELPLSQTGILPNKVFLNPGFANLGFPKIIKSWFCRTAIFKSRFYQVEVFSNRGFVEPLFSQILVCQNQGLWNRGFAKPLLSQILVLSARNFIKSRFFQFTISTNYCSAKS